MKIIAEKARIDDIADAIRQKLNVETQYKLSEIPAAINSIYVGGELEPLSATENGDYIPGTGKEGFSAVHVAVPGPTLVTKNIVSNGTYNASQDNADGYSSVNVDVPGGATVEPLEVTENGIYNPPSGVDGYSPVTVNVSGGGSGGPLAYLNSYAENITTGYVANGNWVYSGTQYTNLNTTMFAVEANHSYLFMSGEAHERFRAMFTTEDLSQVTSNVTGTLIINQDIMPALTGVSYTATQNGYVAIYVGGREKKAYGFEGSLP